MSRAICHIKIVNKQDLKPDVSKQQTMTLTGTKVSLLYQHIASIKNLC